MTRSLARVYVLAFVTCAAGCSQPGATATAGNSAASPPPILAAPGRIEGESEVVEVGAAVDGVLEAVLVQQEIGRAHV